MPSNFEKVESISRPAGQDLSGDSTQYLFGRINSAAVTGPGPSDPGRWYGGAASDITVDPGNVIVNTSSGGQCEGIITGKAKFGQPVEFVIGNRTLIKAGAAFLAGAQLQSDANGMAITQSGSGHILGIALEPALGEGDVVSMIFSPRGEA